MKTKHFREIVLTEFSDLMHKYNLNVADSIDTFSVQLQNAHVCIQISYDYRLSYEVTVCLGLITEEAAQLPEFFTLGEVYRELQIPESRRFSELQSTCLESVKAFLQTTAEALSQFASNCLEGEKELFERLHARRYLESKDYTQKIQLSERRKLAKAAWSAKDYQRFVQILDGFRFMLTESENKKLDHATAKISDP